jgi:hypothetical protein
MHWFLNLLEELGIECQVGDAAKIRAAEPCVGREDTSATPSPPPSAAELM